MFKRNKEGERIMKLQITLDILELDEAMDYLEQLAPYADIVEVGTPLSQMKGFKAVQKVKEKYPEHNGLCCGCAIFRKHNDSHVIAFSKKWWETYSQYCQRDQMSANYALWKVNLQPEVLWGKDFYSTHRLPHIHQEGVVYKASFTKVVESYILIAFLKFYYITHGISWSRWENHE